MPQHMNLCWVNTNLIWCHFNGVIVLPPTEIFACLTHLFSQCRSAACSAKPAFSELFFWRRRIRQFRGLHGADRFFDRLLWVFRENFVNFSAWQTWIVTSIVGVKIKLLIAYHNVSSDNVILLNCRNWVFRRLRLPVSTWLNWRLRASVIVACCVWYRDGFSCHPHERRLRRSVANLLSR